MHMSRETTLCVFGVLVSVLLRICTSIHSYSGQGKPPMFGDYEAQRHWMELTINLPMKDWYRNTTDNDLQYWGLDYPPLTAYHSYLCGIVAKWINPEYVELFKSRGYESEAHKLFMRYTVLIADLLVYIPAVVFYFYATRNLYTDSEEEVAVKKAKDKTKKKALDTRIPASFAIVLGLLYPGLILIDHGHFQYNCVSLGFAVLAITYICLQRHVLASFFFCLALNYKQMELYHAFPFFLYLLSSCVPRPGKTVLSSCAHLLKIALTVVVTFAVIWLPFLFSFGDTLQVVHRLFPIARGVFEDKVANVWCALNVSYKFKTLYCDSEMLRLCTATTLAAMLPSSIDLFVRPNVKKFVPALINSSLAFFLFSFQVHEKSILIVSIPVLLYMPNAPIVCIWFLVVSVFSMLPLLVKDGLAIAFVALMTFYVVAFKAIYEYSRRGVKSENKLYVYYRDLLNVLVGLQKGGQSLSDVYQLSCRHFIRNRQFLKCLFLYVCVFVSATGCLLLSVGLMVIEPPVQYPDLYPLLISVYSCAHFVSFFVYFNVMQLRVPQDFDGSKFVKLKTS